MIKTAMDSPAITAALPNGDARSSAGESALKFTGEETDARPSVARDGVRDMLPRGSGRPLGDGLTRL